MLKNREFERLRSRLRAFGARSYGVPERDLDDIVQTAFLLYWARRDEVEDPEPWIVATFGRQCLMYWRSRRASREDQSGLEIEPVSMRPERGALSSLALRLDLQRALATLPDPQLRLLRLRVVEELSPSEVAADLGYSRDSIRQTLRRTLRRLREALQDPDGPEPPRRSMTTCELAEVCGTSVHTVEHYRRRGLLPVVGSGKTSRLRFPEAVEALRRIRRPRGKPPATSRNDRRRPADNPGRAPAAGR